MSATYEEGRVGVGIELKPSYYEQAIRNLAAVDTDNLEAEPLFAADYADA